MILNVPPVDRAPGSRKKDDTYRKAAAKAIGEINWRLKEMVNYFNRNHPDSKMFYLDTNYIFSLTLDNPRSFTVTQGIKDVTNFCVAYQG